MLHRIMKKVTAFVILAVERISKNNIAEFPCPNLEKRA